jgi:hypothetical protein
VGKLLASILIIKLPGEKYPEKTLQVIKGKICKK